MPLVIHLLNIKITQNSHSSKTQLIRWLRINEEAVTSSRYSNNSTSATNLLKEVENSYNSGQKLLDSLEYIVKIRKLLSTLFLLCIGISSAYGQNSKDVTKAAALDASNGEPL